jgi:putative oxidoreductase
MLGWYGGNGFSGTMGFFTRFTAASLALIMVGAMTLVHWQHGFFMNWFGQQAGEGYEYHLLATGLCLSLFMTGGGKFSVDAVIAERLKRSSD